MDPRFEAYEVQPVQKITHENGQETMEPVPEGHPEIYCWSVYGKLASGEVECLADCPSKAIADHIARALTGKVYLFIGDTRESNDVAVFWDEADAQQAFIDAVNDSYAKRYKKAETMVEAQELYDEATDCGGEDYYRIEAVSVERGKVAA